MEDPSGIGLVLGLAYVPPSLPFCFLKGRRRLGTWGIFILGPALIGAVRIARPDSTWARKFYKPGSYKMREAIRRFPIDPLAEQVTELDVENARLKRMLAEAELDKD